MRTYSLSQAAEVTGNSMGRFRYNKAKLIELGAVVTDNGWSIPETALVQLGWLNPNRPAKRKPTKLEKAQEELKALRAENASLRTQLETAGRRGLFGFKRSK